MNLLIDLGKAFKTRLRIVLLVAILMIVNACQISLNGPSIRQGIFSYYKETYKECPDLFSIRSEPLCIDKNRENSKVLLINGHELRKCVNLEHIALIYLWRPNCKSINCISLDQMQLVCSANKIKLFIIATYFDLDAMKKNYNISEPLMAINPEYYKTNFQNRYISKFIFDLVGVKLKQDNGNFIVFKDAQFLGQYVSIEALKSKIGNNFL